MTSKEDEKYDVHLIGMLINKYQQSGAWEGRTLWPCDRYVWFSSQYKMLHVCTNVDRREVMFVSHCVQIVQRTDKKDELTCIGHSFLRTMYHVQYKDFNLQCRYNILHVLVLVATNRLTRCTAGMFFHFPSFPITLGRQEPVNY